MNILLTGASRGIGAATLEALTSAGHRVAGHSTKGGNGLIAGDLADPASTRKIWGAALDRLGGTDRRARQQCRHLRRRRRRCA